jgi:hypothetical protein
MPSARSRDAVRFACTALLAHQGLRPTSKCGHYAVEHSPEQLMELSLRADPRLADQEFADAMPRFDRC